MPRRPIVLAAWILAILACLFTAFDLLGPKPDIPGPNPAHAEKDIEVGSLILRAGGGRLRLSRPSATPLSAATANARDAAWQDDWAATGLGLYATAGKTVGKVLLVGDSFTTSSALRNWAAEAPSTANGQTAEDDAILGWIHAREGWDTPPADGVVDADNTSGLALCTKAIVGGRTLTAKSGASAADFLAAAPPGSTTDRATARAWLVDPANAGLPIDVIATAFGDAQFAVVLFSGVPAGGSVADLATICGRLEAAGILPILETLPHRYIPGDAAATVAYNRDWVDPYNANIKALARSRGYPLVDTAWAFALQRPEVIGSPLLQADGVHPSGATGGYTTTSSPYADGGDPATHRAGAALANVGYLLRAWLIVQKMKQVKALVADAWAAGAAPSGLTALTISDRQVDLAWDGDGSSAYAVERAPDDAGAPGAWAEVGTTGPGVATFSNVGIAPGSTLWYRVANTSGTTDPVAADTPEAFEAGFVTRPFNLTAEPTGPTTMAVTWDNNTFHVDPNAYAFVVEQAPDVAGAPGTWTALAASGGGESLLNLVTGLSPSTRYWFRARGSHFGAASPYYTPYCLPTSATTPPYAAPTGLLATIKSATSVDLAWDDAATGEDGYSVERAPDDAGAPGAWAEVGTTGPGVATYSDAGLVEGTRYWYRARATGPAGFSSYGPLTSSTPQAGDPAGPGVWTWGSPTITGSEMEAEDPPWHITATPHSANEVRLGMYRVYSGGPPASAYIIERSADGATGWAVAGRAVASLAPDRTSLVWADTTVLPGSTWYYRARRRTDFGVARSTGGAWNFRVTDVSATSVETAWDAQPGATSYQVQWFVFGAWATIATTSGTTHAHSSATLGFHPRRVVAVGGAAGASPVLVVGRPSPAIGATTPALGTWTPDGLHVVAVDDVSADVTWDEVPLATAYHLERSPAGAGTWTSAYSGASNRAAVAGLAAATTYDWRVRATATGFDSRWSPTVTTATYAAGAGRRLLRPGDFTYVGSFILPYNGGGYSLNYVTSGIALKEGGTAQPYLFGLLGGADATRATLYEVQVPGTPTTTAPFPEATFVRRWGDPIQGRGLFYSSGALASIKHSPGGLENHGIDFDPATNRLWWSSGIYYNVNDDQNPSIGHATLDLGANAIAATAGPWALDRATPGDPSEKRTKGGSVRVPRWFADAHLGAGGAAYRAAGFGGAFSGLGSSGPTLFAFAESDLTAATDCEAGMTYAAAPRVPAIPLCSHDFTLGTDATRPPGYRTRVGASQDPPSPGVGLWQWTDYTWGAGCWIDDDAGTRARHGFLFAANFGYGTIHYKMVNTHTGLATGGTCNDGGVALGFGVLDPADMALAASGAESPDFPGPRPASCWLMDAPNSDQRDVPYWGHYDAKQVGRVPTGMAFDASVTPNRLYVSRNGYDALGTVMIDIYEVD